MTPFEKEVYVGSRELVVYDADENISFRVWVQYPALQKPEPLSFGPYSLEVSVNANLVAGVHPLVLVSHGSGGTPFAYRTISTFLAKCGFIVVLPEHYGNNRNNNELENTDRNLVLRPKHIRLMLDQLLADPFLNGQVLPGKVAMIGHSMGGYTALALAGGIARTPEGRRIETVSDDRIRALVLMAPGTGWFFNGLQEVRIPILLLTAEHDLVLPPWTGELVRQGVPDPSLVECREIRNAGHFSFLSPFPAAMVRPGFLPATDPEGFDRQRFHETLPEEILRFLKNRLDL